MPFKPSRLVLHGLAFFAVQAVAAEATSPPEVSAAAPTGTHLIFFKTSGNQPDADAVAVYETAADASGSRKRDLIVFRKKDGTFHAVAQSDKIIACSTCTPQRDDPFMGGSHVDVTPGHIQIEQIYGDAYPSGREFDFAYDASSGTWKVVRASRSDSTPKGEEITKQIPLPASGLLKDFDGQWTSTSYTNALVVSDKAHAFRFLLSQRDDNALNASVKTFCSEKGDDCRVIARVQDGCLSLARDASGQFFASATPTTASQDKASQEAMAACKAKGQGECEAVRTSCSAGPL